jgi:hypothetical protein
MQKACDVLYLLSTHLRIEGCGTLGKRDSIMRNSNMLRKRFLTNALLTKAGRAGTQDTTMPTPRNTSETLIVGQHTLDIGALRAGMAKTSARGGAKGGTARNQNPNKQRMTGALCIGG